MNCFSYQIDRFLQYAAVGLLANNHLEYFLFGTQYFIFLCLFGIQYFIFWALQL